MAIGILVAALCFAGPVPAYADTPDKLDNPRISRNGAAADVTVQELTGIVSRPFRVLIDRNNAKREDKYLRVHALGVTAGDILTAVLAAPEPGIRASVYRIFRLVKDGPRYFTMPLSVYLPDSTAPVLYTERIDSAGEEFLVFVFEQTGSRDNKGLQVRYFETPGLRLTIPQFRPNLWLTSFKLRMKDLAAGDNAPIFERDAQLLIDRLVNPKRVVILRLWKYGT